VILSDHVSLLQILFLALAIFAGSVCADHGGGEGSHDHDHSHNHDDHGHDVSENSVNSNNRYSYSFQVANEEAQLYQAHKQTREEEESDEFDRTSNQRLYLSEF
jgi:hypothetical protein